MSIKKAFVIEGWTLDDNRASLCISETDLPGMALLTAVDDLGATIELLVKKEDWFELSNMTGRYGGDFEWKPEPKPEPSKEF